VQSILNQSWRNLEVIAVDDASTDETLEILTQIAKLDPRVKVMKNSVNVGPYVCKNRALSLATGAYVTGHDSDDLAFPDRLTEQMAPILLNARCKATIGYSLRVDNFGNFGWPPVGKSIYNYDGVLRLAYISLLIERKTFDKLFGFWDSVRVAADGEMLERTVDALPGAFSLVKSCGNLLLFHDGSLTQNVESELSLVSGHADVRANYKKAYRAWHSRTNKYKRQLSFPPNPRLFDVPAKIEVPLQDILELIKHDERQKV
jgi:glycosyltransferase involved in cell wall biosynthesis